MGIISCLTEIDNPRATAKRLGIPRASDEHSDPIWSASRRTQPRSDLECCECWPAVGTSDRHQSGNRSIDGTHMTVDAWDVPSCPRCGSPMTVRETRRGRDLGSLFWGCPRYPKCRGSRDIDYRQDEPSTEEVSAPISEPINLGSQLKVGEFVWTYDPAIVGKLVELSPDHARVRIVFSAAHSEERVYDPSQLERAFLYPQTRVYVVDEKRETWSAGRVIDYDRAAGEDGLAYVVRLPGRDDAPILERELETRCYIPVVDPTDVLATGGIESQAFHDRRINALRSLLAQKNASIAVSGLVSANVHLMRHQLEVVRRVWEDPLQRFLLADEVGLGKTIEAGAILRQLLTDTPSARAAVVAPAQLLRQWERELREKFDIDAENGEVILYDLENLVDVLADDADLDLLIVDEVHHLIGASGVLEAGYELLANIAHNVQRLLLLTATPVLSDDAATLALLHLLDPVTYPLGDVAGFRKRSELRQRFGELVLALDPEAPLALLGPTIAQIVELLDDDRDVRGACVTVLSPALTNEERQVAVLGLRDLISDNYRLDQRLIRTRRVDAGWPDRFCHIDALEVDDHSTVEEFVDLLERWRSEAAAVATPMTEGRLACLYEKLVEALGRDPDEFAQMLSARSAALRSGEQEAYPGEMNWIEDSLAACSRTGDGMNRLELCVASVELTLRGLAGRAGGEAPRIVAFTSSTSFADRLVAGLQVLNVTTVAKITRGMSDSQVDDAVKEFLESTAQAVLVADRSAEEGLNLQAADGLLLMDLPFAPDRLEQRIGRLDRMGRLRQQISTRVVLPSDADSSPWLAWHELLRDGFGLYTRSISDVHFMLKDMREQIRIALFRRGAAGLADLTNDFQNVLVDERRRQDRQYALERLDLEARDAQGAFVRLEAAEQRVSELKGGVSGWLFDVLRLGVQEPVSGTFRVHWHRHAQIPEKPVWRERFEPALDRLLTFERGLALNDPSVRLVRPGFTLVDEMLRLMNRDDRGTAFATWRPDWRWPAEEEECLVFRLTYVVEIDQEQLRELLKAHSSIHAGQVRSMADELFPPWIETRDYDSKLEQVSDPLLVEILRRAYNGSSDVNLAGRLDLIDTTIGRLRFAALCSDIRARSEELLRSEREFATQLESTRRDALQTLAAQRARLDRRHLALESIGETDSSLNRRRTAVDILRKIVDAPRLRLESIGALVISHDLPGQRRD